MNLLQGNLPDRLAAEYVLGTLRGGARRRFQTLLLAHPALRDAVTEWEQRLLPIGLRTEPIEPAEAVWTAIESRLGWREKASSTHPRWWSRVAWWRAATAVATLAALALGTLLQISPVLAPAPAPKIVVLQSTSNGAQTLVAGLSGDGHELVVKPLQAVSLTERQSLELWAVPRAGQPRSLGLIAPDRPTTIARGRLPADTRALAVSLEPSGGSPTGQPTGPVLFEGALT